MSDIQRVVVFVNSSTAKLGASRGGGEAARLECVAASLTKNSRGVPKVQRCVSTGTTEVALASQSLFGAGI